MAFVRVGYFMNTKICLLIIGTTIAVSSTVRAVGASKKNVNLDSIEQSPDAVKGAPDLVWRYIPGVGWRKFSPEGGQYYDWKQWEKTSKPMWLRRF